MSYNLLFDTQFNNVEVNWKCVNCSFENGKFISTNKVFGIWQEIIVPNLTTLYFRCNYSLTTKGNTKLYLGIQNGDSLSVNITYPKNNVKKSISIVETNTQESIKVHISVESTENYNELVVTEPLLCDLERFSKSTYLKPILDKSIKYRIGYKYSNLLGYNELKPDLLGLENAKVGSIFNSLTPIDILIDAKLEKGKSYLLKMDYVPINDLGYMYFSYGGIKSKTFENEQIYLLFRVTMELPLYLHIVPTSVLPYQVNLRHILLTETTSGEIGIDDIPYLPFI